MKQKIQNYVTGNFKKIIFLSGMLVALLLFASTSFSFWAPDGSIIKKCAMFVKKHISAPGKTIAVATFVAAIKKKKEDWDALTPEEQATFQKMDKVLEDNFLGYSTKEETEIQFNEIKNQLSPESLKKLIDSANKEYVGEMETMKIKMDQLATMGGKPSGGAKNFKDMIKADLMKAENAAMRLKMKNEVNEQVNFKMEYKAVTITESGTTAGTNYPLSFPSPEVIPGLNNVARNQPFILQLMNVQGTNRENIVYQEKDTVSGNAGWVAENAASSQVSFGVKISNSTAKMVSAYVEVTTQALDDVDYLASEIEKEILYQCAISLDTGILQGTGAGNSLYGIAYYASAYVLSGATAVTTTLPNTMDCVLACATQIAYDNFRPDICVLNTIDYNQVKMLKGTTGYYLVNPNANNDRWGGITVVPSNQVPVGQIMVMDSMRSNIFKYQDFTISFGWINANFINHVVTIMGQMRVHSFVKSNDVNAFVYDTLANVKAAITTV